MRMVSGQFVPSSAGLKPMAGSICSSRKVPPRLASCAWTRRDARGPRRAAPAMPAAVVAMNARRLTMTSLPGCYANGCDANATNLARNRRDCNFAASRAAAGKMNDQGDDGDEQEEVDQASRHVESKPAEDPYGNEDDEQDQEHGKEHGDLLLSRPLTLPSPPVGERDSF